eukprot:366119-Chlamydomonas_euryale.AAC.5
MNKRSVEEQGGRLHLHGRRRTVWSNKYGCTWQRPSSAGTKKTVQQRHNSPASHESKQGCLLTHDVQLRHDLLPGRGRHAGSR